MLDLHRRHIPHDSFPARQLNQGLPHDSSVGDLGVTIRRRQRRRLSHRLRLRDTFGAILDMLLWMRRTPSSAILGPFRSAHVRSLDRSAASDTCPRKLAQWHQRQ